MGIENFDRRQFLRSAGIAGAAMLFERDILGAVSRLSEPSALIRKDIDALTGVEIAAFRKGVSVMQGRSASLPTSWIFQANIHGAPFLSGSSPAWRKCQHGSFFFLAWHRMYLYFFERILRAASESPDLTLPYWNYSKNTQAARALPLAFRAPTTGNPLFVAERSSGINAGLLVPSSAVQTGMAMSLTNFTGNNSNFGGRLGGSGSIEFQPHNLIHSHIRGLMGNPETAARDPIFWLHHANIDRLWNQWLSLGGGRANPLGSAQWTTRKFDFFDENGAKATMSACQILDSAAQLGYRYDTDTGPVGGACMITLAQHSMEDHSSPIRQQTIARRRSSVVLGEKPVSVDVTLGNRARARMRTRAAGNKNYLLNISGISYTHQPGVHFDVYLNLPPGDSEPDWTGVHYAGPVAFFAAQPDGGGDHSGHTGTEQTLNITQTVRKLRAMKLWKEDSFQVTFVARGLDNPDGTQQKPEVQATLKFTTISLIIE